MSSITICLLANIRTLKCERKMCTIRYQSIEMNVSDITCFTALKLGCVVVYVLSSLKSPSTQSKHHPKQQQNGMENRTAKSKGNSDI